MASQTSAGSPIRGQWALVTGASSGIGLALAEALAAAGANLVLVARRLDRLQALAAAQRERHGVEVQVLSADLSVPEAPNDIAAFTRSGNVEIDILVNNAGLLRYGEFAESDVTAQLAMVQVHCLATVHLTRLYLPAMQARRRGHVLIVASTTLVPAPYLTTYAATKGFALLFAEGLREEAAAHGVHVSALCAGPTESELHGQTARSHDGGPKLQSARDVAHHALAGLLADKPRIYPSGVSRLLSFLPRLLPRSTVAGGAARLYRPKG